MNRIQNVVLFFTFLFLLPQSTHAQVLFSEIAWMGTTESANNEWIELFNHGTDAVDVEGWTLTDNVSLSITLHGSIGARSFAVLERTSDATLPNVTAFQIYTGALANDGRTLTLKHADGTVEDEVVGGSDWSLIGGNNTTKETPQRGMTGWVTGTPTPGAQNVVHDTSNTQNTNTQQTSTSTSTVSAKKTVVETSRGGGARQETEEKIKKARGATLTLSIDAPQTVYVHQPVAFVATAGGIGETMLNSLSYTWNFGDTEVDTRHNPTHAFEYPGTYVVYVDATYAERTASARQEMTVLPTSFTLTQTPGGDVLLRNLANEDADIGGYTLQSFVFPPHSFVKGKGSMIIPKNKIRQGDGTYVLYDVMRSAVASLGSSLPKVEDTTRHIVTTSLSKPYTATGVQKNETPILVASTSDTQITQPVPERFVIGATKTETASANVFARLVHRLFTLFGN